MNKEDLELLHEIKRSLYKNKNQDEYFKRKEYIVDGQHVGYQILVPGVDEDYYILLGDDEMNLDKPLTRKELKTLDTKPGIGITESINNNTSIEHIDNKPIHNKPTKHVQKITDTDEQFKKHLRDCYEIRMKADKEFDEPYDGGLF